MNNKEIEDRRKMLVTYISYYLTKDLKMRDVLVGIKDTLVKGSKISVRQFMAVIRFVEREKPFKGNSHGEIMDYFKPLIRGYRKEYMNDTTRSLY